MDFEAVRADLQSAIPFNNHLSLEVVEVAPGASPSRSSSPAPPAEVAEMTVSRYVRASAAS